MSEVGQNFSAGVRIRTGGIVNKGVKKLLDGMAMAVRTMNVIKFAQARQELERLLDCPDPLEEVCSTREAAERLGTHKREVRRRIERGELPARKSGGVWLVRVSPTPSE